jgi:tetratricopeptide (TPR) repeat protein
MPKLSALQWIILLLFQAFYGFAVFTLTKEHYQRSTIAPAPTQTQPAAAVRAPANIMPQFGGDSVIPESVIQDNPQLLAKLGDERFSERRYPEAVELYQKVLALDPNDIDTHNDLGLALHYLGRSNEALVVLKQGVEKNPKFQRIWLTLGFVQMKTAEKDEAKFALQQALEIDPGNAVGAEAKRLLSSLGQP